MFQIVQNYRTRKVGLEEIPIPNAKPGGLLVRNAYSVVSIGTGKMKVRPGKKGLIGKARARPDQINQVLENIKKTGLMDTY